MNKCGTFVGSVWIALLVIGLPLAHGQDRLETTTRTAGATVNLFETLDPEAPIDGFEVHLPGGWALEEVRCFRYGTERIAGQVQSDDKTILFVSDRGITGPQEVVVRVQLPSEEGVFPWGLRPIVWRKPVRDSVQKKQYTTLDSLRRRVEVEKASKPEGSNRALDLSEAAAPLLLRADRLPRLGSAHSFTIAFWMQTNGLGEIALSTWSGKEGVSYPAEFIVDPSGRIRFYSGQPDQYHALRSGQPVADGQWHYVGVVYEASDSITRLVLDGRVSDSLRGSLPAGPELVSLALGERIGRNQTDDDHRSPFSGRIDELRIWPEARSVQQIRHTKNRLNLPESGESSDRSPVRLGFETDEPEAVDRWPERATRVPVSLLTQDPIRPFQAETDGRAVTLLWGSETRDVERFLVERSEQGRTFTTVAELPPADARQSSASGRPEFAYTDENVPGQVMYYRIRLRQGDGDESTSAALKIGMGADTTARQP